MAMARLTSLNHVNCSLVAGYYRHTQFGLERPNGFDSAPICAREKNAVGSDSVDLILHETDDLGRGNSADVEVSANAHACGLDGRVSAFREGACDAGC